MHHAVSNFIANHRPDVPGRVLDVGGRDVNGTLRSLFLDSTEYVACDLREGPAVDIVGDICDLGLENEFDTVICTEVLEHAPNWPRIVESCANALVLGGYLLMTCAGPGRAPHSAIDEQPIRPDEHYRNVSAMELELAFRSAGIEPISVQEVGFDTQAVGIKREQRELPPLLSNVVVSADPFPHIVLDDFWDADLLESVESEFPGDGAAWRRYRNAQENKMEGSDPELWGESTRTLYEILGLNAACDAWGRLFGVPNLTMRTMGGGYHLIKPGGKLDVHADFNRSTEGLYRRLNLLIYLNRNWSEADGGHLELWNEDRCVERILPVFNRTVIFATSSTSYHGHPVPLPGPRSRRSVAAYYFSPQPPADYVEDHSTVWKT